MTTPRVSSLVPQRSKKKGLLLSEPDAWREIAGRVAQNGLIASGLCAEVTACREAGAIAVCVADEMKDRIAQHLDGMSYIIDPDYEDSEEPNYTDVRILAALFLALESEDESNFSVRGATQ